MDPKESYVKLSGANSAGMIVSQLGHESSQI